MTSRQLTHQAVTAAATQTHSLIQRRPLAVNKPGDRFEREADRAADAVMRGRGPAPFTLSAVPVTRVQREDAPKEKTDAEKYQEAAGKIGEAFLETPLGKELVANVKQDKLVKGATEAGKSFIGTLPGKIITGAAAAGAVATLAATHKELPAQIPEIPLDVLTPGLSVEITYKGPVDKPTEAMITFKFAERAPKGSGDRKPGMTGAEKFRAETARIAADQAKFRAGMKYPPGSPEDLQQKAEDAAASHALARYAPGPDLDAMAKKYPWLSAQKPQGGPQMTPPTPSFGYKPPALLGDEYRLKLPGEQKKKDDEPVLQRQASSAAAVDAAPPVVHDVLQSPGQPLDAGTRAFMESRFGHDFGRVRVHTDARAAESARAVNAVAYAAGQDIVFGAGQYAPSSAAGLRLLAHEMTHVLQQGAAPVHAIQRELIYGSAYKRPYTDDPTETRDSEAGKWFPASIDMAATAANSGGGTGTGKFADLLKDLAGKSVGAIKELGLIGHANSSAFSLGGTIKPGDNVYFATDAIIDSGTLAANAAAVTGVKDRFAAGAKIILYGCHAGVGQALLDEISQAFGVCVEGFKNEITWCIIWDGATRKILSRGRVYVIDINDPLQIRPSCEQFYADVKSLKADGKSCKGVPVVKPAPPSPKTNITQNVESE